MYYYVLLRQEIKNFKVELKIFKSGGLKIED